MHNLLKIVAFSLFIFACKNEENPCLNGQEYENGLCECTYLYSGDYCQNEIRANYYGNYQGYIYWEEEDSTFLIDYVAIDTAGLNANQFKLNIYLPTGILNSATVTIHRSDSAWFELYAPIQSDLFGPLYLFEDSIYGDFKNSFQNDNYRLYLVK